MRNTACPFCNEIKLVKVIVTEKDGKPFWRCECKTCGAEWNPSLATPPIDQ